MQVNDTWNTQATVCPYATFKSECKAHSLELGRFVTHALGGASGQFGICKNLESEKNVWN